MYLDFKVVYKNNVCEIPEKKKEKSLDYTAQTYLWISGQLELHPITKR